MAEAVEMNANLVSKDRLGDKILGLENGARVEEIVRRVQDWQIIHGSLLKVVPADEDEASSAGAKAHAVPVSLVPSPWSRRCFDRAVALQDGFNELYARLASNEKGLERMLRPLMGKDGFAETLWSIHQEAKTLGIAQKWSLGIFRSDYMANSEGIHQVEFNTFACSGATHATRISKMYSYLHKIGMYGDTYGPQSAPPAKLPSNSATTGIVRALLGAHQQYLKCRSSSNSASTGILMIVQHGNFNVSDERPIEYALWDVGVPVYRLEFRAILQYLSLGPNKELLYKLPSCELAPLEVSVVYYRAGHKPAEYLRDGAEARLLIEISQAIKCPSILSHLTTFKHVQQELAKPGALQACFPGARQIPRVDETFVPMFVLDKSERGIHARNLALNEEQARRYILKPSREGGGNNVYGRDIPAFLQTVREELWPTFTLMEKIEVTPHNALLLSQNGLYMGPAVSELGIVGSILWRPDDRDDGIPSIEIDFNKPIGWTFKTKPSTVDEMSVVKGYGFFDSPYLLDD
ncbi:glutathione synthetase [Verruconis gallopava]|uniref:Glutathione synthetase n=1 Tax=Verruconis gallopava TaxID=253628 RepID=A0A0D2AQI8_9PEZI|nr:glutathione synthetase [Verruconis gallopava]KIW01414.1 glutathione synthetase [Verruconis gallopava]